MYAYILTCIIDMLSLIRVAVSWRRLCARLRPANQQKENQKENKKKGPARGGGVITRVLTPTVALRLRRWRRHFVSAKKLREWSRGGRGGRREGRGGQRRRRQRLF